MRISIIGSGNIATVLGRLFMQKGHSICQVIGRDEQEIRALAQEFSAGHAKLGNGSDLNIDLFIVALSDNALPEALSGFHLQQVPVFHTAGALPFDILKSNSSNYGVLYPLQSLRKELKEIPSIPFLIDANNDASRELLQKFAFTLSDIVSYADDAKRLRLHTAAVIVNNFTNHLYSVAKDFCENEHVEFDLLKPLIKETAEKIMTNLPAHVQTGPAVRKDITTLEKHLRLLAPYPKLRTMYMRMTDSIMNP